MAIADQPADMVHENRFGAWLHAVRRWFGWTRAQTPREASLEALLTSALGDAVEAAREAAEALARSQAALLAAEEQIQMLQSQVKIRDGEIAGLGDWIKLMREQVRADLAMQAARAARHLTQAEIMNAPVE